MATSSRSSLLFGIAILLEACVGSRRVDLDWYTPAECVAPDCPLGAVRSLRIVLERVDGTVEVAECEAAPEGLCRLEDLADVLFIARASPSQGVEIFVTGWTEPACGGVLALGCETFGGGVVDLGRIDRVPMWCECPYVAPDAP
ncbi:MAG: hypothetical protein KF729_22160 [Sandaracinaceae bacterium]|nr:hypothetical protein [Sandaracinaceae bacterium]